MRGGYTARSRPLGWAWVAVASYGISSAYADETAHKVSAEVLFEEGKRLVGSGQYDEACPKFAESRRREPGIGITLYLADCYERAGKTASAWVTFREAAAMAMASGQEQRERVARSRASALEPTLSRLMVVVEGSAASVAGLQVVRDTVALGKETWGVAMPVDPGIHRVQARAPGYVSFETSVSLVPSAGTVTVTVPPLAPEPLAPTPSPLQAPPTTSAPVLGRSAPLPHVEPTAGGSWLRTATVLGAGVGVAGLGLGVFFGARARHNLTVALRECDEGSPLQCSPAGVQQLARARESATFSNASFGVGLAGAASSLVFWILSPPARPHVPPTIAFRPALGSTFSGVQLNGHW
jgi:hypothetical protein